MSHMPLGGNDGSAKNLDQASQWLNKCMDTHPDCGPTDPLFCPSRLLKLGGFKSDAPDTLQVILIETKQFSQGMAYACLSHCWGGITPACVTNKNTIHTNFNGIAWSEIPRTFQDAMVLCWRLGLQYIWIDSLCIIQGDEEDWRKEAAAMASIYSNSSITIAATSSANCLQGLYRTDPARDQVHELNVLLSDHRPARVLAHADSPRIDWMGRSQDRVAPYAGPKMPLLERAWFFQEWHLSPRLLHFADGEIVWQCKCGSLSQWEAFEGHPFPCPAAKQVENAMSMEDDPPPKLMAEKFWFDAVEAFSALKLTFHEKDALAAISGVAKKTEQFVRGDTYVAGIWLDSLLMGLCWITRRPLGPGRSKEWAAPSWSWASINGPVSYKTIRPTTDDTPVDISVWDKKCHLDKVTFILSGEDATGPLKDARITASGLAIPCKLRYDSKDRHDNQPDYSIGMRRVRWLFRAYFTPDYALDQPGDHHLAPGSSLQCLRLLGCRNYKEETSYVPYSICLVLTKSKRQKGAYERIGLLEIRSATTAIKVEAKSTRSTFIIV